MPISNAIIEVKKLRLRTFIGFNQEEREKQQDVVVNLEIHYPVSADVFNDSVDAALNYKTITKEEENNHFFSYPTYLCFQKNSNIQLDRCPATALV